MRVFARRTVRTPQGEDWRVERRWTSRGLPAGHAALEAVSQGDPMMDNPAGALAVIVGGFVVAVVVIPLLLFGIELIILGFALAGAIVVRGMPQALDRASEPGRDHAARAHVEGRGLGTLRPRGRGGRRSARSRPGALTF
jgi:hypothetical protein